MSIKHQSQLMGKYWCGKRIEHAIEFFSNQKFGGLKESKEYLNELGYTSSDTFINKPIGFLYEAECVLEWENMKEDDKVNVDGVILPNRDYENGSSLVVFFKIPRY